MPSKLYSIVMSYTGNGGEEAVGNGGDRGTTSSNLAGGGGTARVGEACASSISVALRKMALTSLLDRDS